MKKIWNQCVLLFWCFVWLILAAPNDVHAVNSIYASATAISSSKIELTWESVEQAEGYAIYRKGPTESGYRKLKTAYSTVYVDSSVSAGVTYYYKVIPISRETGKETPGFQTSLKAKAPKQVSIDRVTAKSPTKLMVTWQPSEGSSGYKVLRAESKAGNYQEIAQIDGKRTCSYLDENVVPGKNYFYKVRPVNQGQKGAGSDSDPVQGRTMPKTMITSITSLSSSRIQITWKKVSNAQTYEIYRSAQKDGGFKKIASVRRNVRSYTDQTVKSGKKYYYKIVVIGTVDGVKVSSGYSEAVSFRALKQVRISSVKVTANNELKIRWDKVSGATKYRIFRATSKTGKYKKIATVSGTSTVSYTDKTVISGKTYYYKVQAYADNQGVISAGSGSKSAAKGAAVAYAIMGETSVTADQMAELYRASGKKFPSQIYKDKGAKNIEKFCEIVIDESEKEGVKAEVIFAQICLETGYLSFGGQVSAEQCNFSGIGATDDGAAGATFSSVKIGIRAQVQHLKGYASTEPLNEKCVDPRFAYLAYKRGTAKYVQDLGNGNWATDPNYATKLMNLISAMKSY